MTVTVERVLQHPEQILQHLTGMDLASSYVYLSGSLMEGFGNQTSDVDVYVICQHIPANLSAGEGNLDESYLWEGKNLVRNVVHEGVRYDFEYWTRADFDEAVQRLTDLDFKTDGYIPRFSSSDIDLLHRFKYAKPLVNQNEFIRLHQSVPFENLCYYQAVTASEKFTSYVEDIQGALLSSDFGSAFFMVRRLVELAVTAYLSVHGETNPNLKWIYRKLARYQEQTGDAELLAKYLRLQTHPFEETTIRAFVKEAMKFSQNLNIQTQNALHRKQTT